MTILQRIATSSLMAALMMSLPLPAGAQSPEEALMQFQRAADAYAFQHRQVQRRAGDAPDQPAMSTAMHRARAVPAEGSLFTPIVGAAFRTRITTALRSGGCAQPVSSSASVPRASDDASGTQPLASCVSAALPRLPEELAYRVAGIALVLVDVHANLVVDVLHAAFPAR